MKRTGMINIKDILRHRHDLGLPRAQIAAATGVSAGTVSHVLDRAEAAGLSWPLPADLDDDALRARLYPPPVRDSGCCFADYLVSVWLVYIDGLVRGFLTLFQFFRTVSVTAAGLRDEGRWRPENG